MLGNAHAMAINEIGDLFGWGANQHGQLGIRKNGGHSNVPVRVTWIPLNVRKTMIHLGLYLAKVQSKSASTLTRQNTSGGGGERKIGNTVTPMASSGVPSMSKNDGQRPSAQV